MPRMPQNRSYAGPADAAELLVSSGGYALVVRQDITDEQAAALGYALDGDEAVATGRPLAHRTITVSDELAERLDGSVFVNEAGATVPMWPKAGGSPAGQTVDDETLPHTQLVTLDDGSTATPAEVDKLAADFSAAEAAIADLPPGEFDATAAADPVARASRIGVLDRDIAERREQLAAAKARAKAAEKDSAEADEAGTAVGAIDADLKNLVAERDALAKLDEGGA